MGLSFGSVCSGIEAASVAWKPLGWQAAFVSEIEPFPRAVLAHHHPETPLHGDFTTIKAGQYEPIDLLVGGTPCQSFSIAGLRGGLDDDRGNLALEYLRLADRLRPRWLVWENVPGVLSSNGGWDFGAILGGMVELGYGVAYRVLDAQHFGVAQRRRRVFVVGYLGDWRRAAAVLFERESLSGHPAPRREAGKGSAGGAGERPEIGCPAVSPALKARDYKGPSSDGDGDGAPLIAHTLRAQAQAQASHRADTETYVTHSLRGEGFDASEDGTGRGTPLVPICFSSKDHGADALNDMSPTLRAGGHDGSHANAGVPPAIAFDTTQVTSKANYSNPKPGDPMFTMQAGAQHGVGHGSAVRRLTPRECERLQGFPDDYTLIPWRGGMASDGPRYKALGNSMAVPVMRWIGEQIAAVEALNLEAAA